MQFHLDRTGVSCTMKETKHYYLLILYREINGVRKSPQQTAPEFLVNLRAKKRVPENLTDAGVKPSPARGEGIQNPPPIIYMQVWGDSIGSFILSIQGRATCP